MTGIRGECCHDRDCQPVTCDSITETKDGHVWRGLTFKGSQVRASPNAKCHACASKDPSNGGKPLNPYCLFILPST